MTRPEIKASIKEHIEFSERIHTMEAINQSLMNDIYSSCGKTKAKKVIDSISRINREILSIKNNMENIMFKDNKELIDKNVGGIHGEPFMSIYYGGMEYCNRKAILEEILKIEGNL